MAKLNYTEKRNLEEFLQMGSGYVLNFSNRTFRDFVIDSTGLDPDDEKVAGTGSKAWRLRQFMQIQPDHVVGKLLKDMIEYHDPDGTSPLRQRCLATAERLLQSAPVPDATVIAVLSQRDEFEQLAKSVLDSIHKNDPQGGLDRLHTFTTKFVRSLCEQHGLTIDRDKPLHSIFGEYVKELKRLNLIESKMSETILKMSISVLDAFNDVRNNRSLAHDNEKILNENESLLIFNHVTSAIRFVWTLEQSISKRKQSEVPAPIMFDPEADVPF
ncbi:MAG: abortive infection family protein [Acidobacteriaceae bacterium]